MGSAYVQQKRNTGTAPLRFMSKVTTSAELAQRTKRLFGIF